MKRQYLPAVFRVAKRGLQRGVNGLLRVQARQSEASYQVKGKCSGNASWVPKAFVRIAPDFAHDTGSTWPTRAAGVLHLAIFKFHAKVAKLPSFLFFGRFALCPAPFLVQLQNGVYLGFAYVARHCYQPRSITLRQACRTAFLMSGVHWPVGISMQLPA